MDEVVVLSSRRYAGMRVVAIKVPEELVEVIDKLVAMGLYSCRSELIRKAIQLYLEKNKGLWGG